jgi:hypothetical protein
MPEHPDYWIGYFGEALATITEEHDASMAQAVARMALAALVRSGYPIQERIRDEWRERAEKAVTA